MSEGLVLSSLISKRIKLIRQNEVAECGLASLVMIAQYHGIHITTMALRREYNLTSRGLTLRTLIKIANSIGLSARPIRVDLEHLGQITVPAILHWNLDHFVVLERARGSRFLIHDPASGSRWYSHAETSNHFTGVALEISANSNSFKSDIEPRLRINDLWTNLTGAPSAIFHFIFLSLIIQVLALATPFFTQIAIDEVVPSGDVGMLTSISILFAILMIFQVAAAFTQSFVQMSAGNNIALSLASNVAMHLFKLKIPWFEKRNVGDILSRFQSIKPIQEFITDGAPSVLLDVILLITLTIVLVIYSPVLFIIMIAALAINGVIRAGTFGPQRRAGEQLIVAQSREQTILIETIRGMAPLRLAGGETSRHALWKSRLVDFLNASINARRLQIWQTAASSLVFGLESIISIWLAIKMILDGSFSTGMLVAYLAYKGQFIFKAISVTDHYFQFKMLGLHLERLSDIAYSELDSGLEDRISAPRKTLEGSIELVDVSFSYSREDGDILSNVSLKVSAGDHIAITGPSGGGKSTLIKILLGLVQPTSGTILIDGVPLSTFGTASYRQQTAAVLQDDVLYSGTIADNIALFADEPSLSDVHIAAQLVALDSDIEAMPMRYSTLVGDMGSSLSGGQKQRVLLARALYRKPRVLIIDEGTSHLDTDREQHVVASIRELGITRIIVAHREESVKSADKTYILKNGVLSQC